MSDGKGDAKSGARIVTITPRKTRTKGRAAHQNSSRHEKPEAIGLGGKAKNIPNKKAVRRTTERPEFTIGNARSVLDAIARTIEENRFSYTAEFLEKKVYLERLDLLEVEKLEESLEDLVTERAKTLAREKDGKHFVACVSYLNEYVRVNELLKELAPEITDAIKDHAIELFTDYDRSPEAIHDELETFFTLGFLHADTFSELPEFRNAIGKRLVACFEKRSLTDFGRLLFVCWQLGIVYTPEDQVLTKLQEHALSWLEDAFGNKEKDPSDTLILLSQFMEKFENMGIALSAKQVRARPDLLAKVHSALAAVKLYEDMDEATDQIIREIRGTFSAPSWRRLFW